MVQVMMRIEEDVVDCKWRVNDGANDMNVDEWSAFQTVLASSWWKDPGSSQAKSAPVIPCTPKGVPLLKPFFRLAGLLTLSCGKPWTDVDLHAV